MDVPVLYCQLCSVASQTQQMYNVHVQGKRHQLALHKLHMTKWKEQCGVFITNFSALKKEDVLQYFSQFGTITSTKFGDNQRYLILEYAEASSAQSVLKTKHRLQNHNIIVRARVIKAQPDIVNEDPEEDYNVTNLKLKEAPTFSEQINLLLKLIQPNFNEVMNNYNRLCFDLERILRELFPYCKVHPFGSTFTGLQFNNSDVDIYVELRQQTDLDVSTMLNRSRKVLQQSRLFSNIVCIARSRTPIVKCVHIPTKLSCDFNFKNMLGVCNSQLIRYYLLLDPKLMPMMATLKWWGKVHGLSGKNKFSNYSFILLLIFFLQQEPYSLPTVHSLQQNKASINVQEGWNGGFESLSVYSPSLKNATFFDLFCGFFHFYANFDYSLSVICPLVGKTLLKTDFLGPNLLPESYERYNENLGKDGFVPLRVEKPVCIQDPFELTHNVCYGVAPRLLEDFVIGCKQASEILKDAELTPVDLLYKLCTYEIINPDNTLYKENMAQFKFPMGSCLNYLKEKIDLTQQDVEKATRKAWYDTVNQFIVSVLVGILKLEVVVRKEEIPADEQNVEDSVTFNCSGKCNLWEARRSISRKHNDGIPPNTSFIDREIALSAYICDNLYKDLNLTEKIVEFELTFKARMNPIEAEFVLKKIGAFKGCFKTLRTFFVTKLPHWFETYVKELNEQCINKNKETEESESKE